MFIVQYFQDLPYSISLPCLYTGSILRQLLPLGGKMAAAAPAFHCSLYSNPATFSFCPDGEGSVTGPSLNQSLWPGDCYAPMASLSHTPHSWNLGQSPPGYTNQALGNGGKGSSKAKPWCSQKSGEHCRATPADMFT